MKYSFRDLRSLPVLSSPSSPSSPPLSPPPYPPPLTPPRYLPFVPRVPSPPLSPPPPPPSSPSPPLFYRPLIPNVPSPPPSPPPFYRPLIPSVPSPPPSPPPFGQPWTPSMSLPPLPPLLRPGLQKKRHRALTPSPLPPPPPPLPSSESQSESPSPSPSPPKISLPSRKRAVFSSSKQLRAFPPSQREKKESTTEKKGRLSQNGRVFKGLQYKQQPLQFSHYLKQGTFGTVEKYETKYKHPVAVKKLAEMECKNLSPELLREGYVGSRLHHPNIGPLLSFVFEPQLQGTPQKFQPQLVFPLEDGSLGEYFSKLKDLTLNQVLSILGQVFCGLEYLHSLDLVHFDLKPENILVSNWPNHIQAKLGDLGMVQWTHVLLPQSPNSLFTKAYRPPEYLCLRDTGKLQDIKHFQPTKEADMFSAGVALVRILAAWALDSNVTPKWLVPNNIESAQNYFKSLSYAPRNTWSNVGCAANDNPLGTHAVRLPSKTKPFEQKEKQNLLPWLLGKAFKENKTYDDDVPCHRLPAEEVKKRISDPTFNNLLILGYNLLSFDPKKRPTAKQVVASLKQFMNQLNIPFFCSSGLIPAELEQLSRKHEQKYFPALQPLRLQDLGWIKSPKTRRVLLYMYESVLKFFESLPTSQYAFSKESLLVDLNELVTATKVAYKEERKGQAIPEQLIPSLFVWLLSLYISGEKLKSRIEFCHLGKTIGKERQQNRSLETFLLDLNEMAQTFIEEPGSEQP